MKILSTLILSLAATLIYSQTVNYQVEIVQLEADDTGCTSDGFGFDEEVTWHCWAMDDDLVTGWTNDSGDDCYGKDDNVPMVLSPSNTALLSQSSSNANSVSIRLEAWEDDSFSNSVGSTDRCSHDSGDDCHSDANSAISFRNDPMCTWNQYTITSGDFHVIVRVKWEYDDFTGGFDAIDCGLTTNLTGQGSGSWSVYSGNGGTFGDINNPITMFSGTLGTYQILWTSLPDCATQHTTDTVQVDFISAPNPNITSSTSNVCEGNDVIFYAQNGSLYDWSLNTVGNIVLSDGSGQYTLTPSITDNNVYVNVSNGTCSTLDSISLSVNPSPSPTIVDNGSYLSTQNYSAYLWYYNGSPISGASGIDYTPTQGGSYYVEVINSSGCSGQSSPIQFSGVGINEIDNNLSIFPNPTSGIINIVTESKVEFVSVYNTIGKKENIEIRNNKLDLSNLNNGIYFINLSTRGEIITKKIILSK